MLFYKSMTADDVDDAVQIEEDKEKEKATKKKK